jgi:hypothetical protein
LAPNDRIVDADVGRISVASEVDAGIISAAILPVISS